MNDPIDYEKKILKVQGLFRQATDAVGFLTPALNVQSIADKLTVIMDVTVCDAILQVTSNLKTEDESLTIESIDVALDQQKALRYIDGKGHTWFCSEETNHRHREFQLFALLSNDICDGNMLDATWQCSRVLCYIGGCLFPEAYSCEMCARPIYTSHMIVCFDGAVQRFWTVCMPCFDDEYGPDGVNDAPSTNLFLHKVDSVPGSAAVSGDDFIREAQIVCGEIIYEQMLTSTRSEMSHSQKTS